LPTSATSCLTCIPAYGLCGNGCTTCVKTCDNGLSIVNGICTCVSGIVYNQKCVSTCPDGTVNVQNKCEICTSNCATCENTVNSCTSCLAGYILIKN
jgi:proprotein convertase subtilisin/kexin type 5